MIARCYKSVDLIEPQFEVFWNIYPKRSGDRAKSEARSKFLKLIGSGVNSEDIIFGAKNFARYCDDNKKTGTEFVPMAKTWLNQRRWEDYEPVGTKVLDEAEFARLKAKYDKKIAASQ